MRTALFLIYTYNTIYRHVRIHISTHSTLILHTYGAIYGGIHNIYIVVYRHACRHLNAGPCNWQFNWKLDETNEHYILHKHYTVRPHGIVLCSMCGSVEEWVHHHWGFPKLFHEFVLCLERNNRGRCWTDGQKSRALQNVVISNIWRVWFGLVVVFIFHFTDIASAHIFSLLPTLILCYNKPNESTSNTLVKCPHVRRND